MKDPRHRQRRARARAGLETRARTRRHRGDLCAPGNPGIAAVARCVPADVDQARRAARARRARSGRPHRRRPGTAAEPAAWSIAFAAAGLRDRRPDARRRRARIEQGVREGLHGAAPRADRALPRLRLRRRRRWPRSRAASSAIPLVLKADGLAAGKGVVIAEDRAAAEAAVRAAMVERRFGAAGDRLVLEEFLVGEEASYFVLADGDAVRAARVGAGSQAHLRRRPRAEYRRHGRVRAEPADDAGDRAARASTRSSAGARGMAARRASVPRVPLRRPDADRRRPEGRSSSTCASAIPKRR